MRSLILAVSLMALGGCAEQLSKSDAATDGKPTADAASADQGGAQCPGSYPPAVVMTTPDEQLFIGGVQRPDGSLVAAEVVRTAAKTVTRLLSMDTKGLDGKLDVRFDSAAMQEAVVLIADGDGWAMVGNGAGKDADVWFARVSAAGVPQVTTLDLGGGEATYGLLKVGAQYAISGQRSGIGPTSAFFALLDAKGVCIQNCTAAYTGGTGSNSSSGNAIALLPGGDYLLAGESIPAKGAGGLDGAVWRIGADFKEQTFKSFGSPGEDWFWGIQAASLSTQGWLAFGQRSGEGWLVAVDSDAEQRWQRTLPETKDVLSVAAMPYGWAIGAKTAGGQRLIGIDHLGNVLWQQSHLGKPYSVLVQPGGFALVGDLQGDARVLFTDPWGNADCQTAGLCAGVLSCDDNVGCTDDICAAKVGCVHALANTGRPCTDGKPCTGPDLCTGGSCAGAVITCDDGKKCTTDACDPTSGACSHATVAGCQE